MLVWLLNVKKWSKIPFNYSVCSLIAYCTCSYKFVFCSEEVKKFTPKDNTQTLSVTKECNCLFYYGENDPDEYKKQGKDWVKVSN